MHDTAIHNKLDEAINRTKHELLNAHAYSELNEAIIKLSKSPDDPIYEFSREYGEQRVRELEDRLAFYIGMHNKYFPQANDPAIQAAQN
jgi:hypothetical protein